MTLSFHGTARGAMGLALGTVAALGLLSYGVTSEVPVGSLSGKVVMTPDGRALPGAEVVVYPEFEAPEGARSSWSVKTGPDGEFRFRRLPAGKFKIQAWGKAHSMPRPEPVVVAEGKLVRVDLGLKRSDPELTVIGNQRVYTPDERPEITVNGFTTSGFLEITTYSVPVETLTTQPNLGGLFSSIAFNRIATDPEETKGLKVWNTASRPLTRKDIEGVFAEQVALAPMPEGVYLVKVETGESKRYTWLTVSRIALVTKTTDSQAQAFVVDLKSGQPVPGAKIQALADGSATLLGRTGADGVCVARDWASTPGSGLLATHQGSLALSWFYRAGGQTDGHAVWIQTDRPIYRPGDKVRFRTVVRQRSEEGYRNTSGLPATVAVFDPDDLPLVSRSVTLDDFGTAHGEFDIPTTVMPGSYQIRVTCGGSTETAYVPVASYRKPEFRVVVEPAQKMFVRGDAVTFVVRAEYFTGEPVAGAEVSGTLSRSQIYRWTPFEDTDPDEDQAYWGGDPIKELAGRTDGDGRATFTVPAVEIPDPDQGLYDHRLEFSVVVTDQGGRAFTGSGTAELARGEFSLETDIDRFVADPGQSVTVTVRGKNRATDRPEPGRQVTLVVERERFSGRRVVRVETGRRALTLDGDGQSQVSFGTGEPGSLRIVATATDSRGNSVRSEAFLWVYGGGADFGSRIAGLQVVLDKPTYRPGDKAVAIVRTDKPGGAAWVTLEDDQVRWSQIVPLKGLATKIEFDALGRFAPNVMLRVAYVKDKEFHEAGRTLRVDLAEKKLDLQVEPDRSTAKPGETIVYTVRARDHEGRPVEASVALGVVDEGVYSIAEDRDDPLRAFYPRKWSMVSTDYSFPTIYLDGEDKTPTDVEVRRNLMDTAYWNPDVRTGPDGTALVKVTLPDNVTEWRATATAVTRDTLIGRGRARLVAQKDLMVRLAAPAFMTVGDEIVLAGRVSNTTERALTLTTRLESSGATIDGAPAHNLRVGARATADVRWKVTAATAGTATFTLTAWAPDGGPSDGVEVTVPVEIQGRWTVEAKAGEAAQPVVWDWEVDPNAVAGSLKVTVGSSLIGPLVDSLPGLIDFPYGCVEQTTSRFVPAVLVGRLVERMGLDPPAETVRLPQVVRDSLTRLKLSRNGPAWGWWEHDKPDPWMTAYVLEGLAAARDAGVQVPGALTAPARQWAIEWLDREQVPQVNAGHGVRGDALLQSEDPGRASPVNLDDAVYLAAVVARQGPSKASEKWLKAAEAQKDLSVLSLAQTALARLEQRARGEPGGDRAESVYKSLIGRADETELTMEWPQEGWSEPTAAGLQAVVAFEPASPRVMKVVRSLMAGRRGRMWSSTRDTARVLMGLVPAAARFAAPATGSVKVKIDGRQVASMEFAAGSAGSSKAVEVPWAELPKGRFRLELVPTNGGSFPYSVELRHAAPEDRSPARTNIPGLRLTREYYALRTERLEDGRFVTRRGTAPVTKASSGQILRCRIVVYSERSLTHVMIEDPVPANFRIVDSDTPSLGQSWGEWWSRSVYLDDKAVFFADQVVPGKAWAIEYAVRAETPGACVARPTVLSKMYQPDLRASTPTVAFEVGPK